MEEFTAAGVGPGKVDVGVAVQLGVLVGAAADTGVGEVGTVDVDLWDVASGVAMVTAAAAADSGVKNCLGDVMYE